METEHIRQSAIAASSCLKRYHDIYELGIEDSSDESRRGTAFHDIALQRYIPRLVELGEDQNLDELDRAFQAGIVATKCPPHLYDEVEDLTFAWGRRFELDRRALLAVEERQRAFGASGSLDLAFAYRTSPRGSLLSIRDFKTWRAILNEDAVRAEFQGKLYTRLAMHAWPGFDVYEFVIDHVRYGVETAVEYSAEDLESLDRQVETRLAQIADARRSGEWPAQPGEHCGFCRLDCSAADDPRVHDRRCANAEEAAIVAGRILANRSRMAADVAALKSWCMTEGAVAAGRMEFAHREVERKKWIVADVLKACEREGAIPPLIQCGKTVLRPLIGTKGAKRRWPDLVAELEAAAVLTKSTTFSAKKIGNEGPEDDEQNDADKSESSDQ